MLQAIGTNKFQYIANEITAKDLNGGGTISASMQNHLSYPFSNLQIIYKFHILLTHEIAFQAKHMECFGLGRKKKQGAKWVSTRHLCHMELFTVGVKMTEELLITAKPSLSLWCSHCCENCQFFIQRVSILSSSFASSTTPSKG